MERGAIGVHVVVFADRGDTFAFIWMSEMRHNDLYIREPDCHFIDQARQRTGKRGVIDERRPGMKKHRQTVLCGVSPKIVKLWVIWFEAGIHRQKFDAF